MPDQVSPRRTTSGYGSAYTPTSGEAWPHESPEWGAAARVLFRVGAAYFALYVVTTQMLGALLIIPGFGFRPLESHGPLQALLLWTAAHVFGVKNAFHGISGSGDKTLNYVHAVGMLVLAAVAAAVWSYLGRERRNERHVAKWFHVFLRFALGSTMITYGFAKLIPLQMPAPGFSRLLETYGDLSPMGVLWSSIGASRSYEMFTGSVEVVSGILLFMPRTWLVGALFALAATGQIFMLNMTYDVPVKLFSFHLVLMSVFLLAPELDRVLNVLVFDRTAEPSTAAPLFANERKTRIARVAQMVFGMYLVAIVGWGAWQSWRSPFGGGGPKPPLYGLYKVTEMSTDGRVQPPLVTDTTRWGHAYVDRGPAFGWATLDNKRTPWRARIDTVKHTIALSSGDSLKRELRYTLRPAGGLEVEGDLGGHRVRATLEPEDAQKRFLLLRTGFHWVQELPFNR